MEVDKIKNTAPVSNELEVIPKAAQKELIDLLGTKNVCFTRELLACYRCGPGAPFRKETMNPHGMVQPETVEEVQGILRIANKYKIPLIVQSTGLGEICFKGGLIIDLYSRMRKIHKIDPESGYALVESGVTCGQLLRALRPYGYWIPFGSYPALTSSLANLVPAGGQTNSMGREDSHCIGLEVVLPTGDIIRTGTAALGYDWWTQYRGVPDLTSLWIPSIGTMGIITKAALRIIPLGEAQAIVIAGFNNFDNAIEWTHKISREVMVNNSMIWSYRWVQWQNWMYFNGKGFVEYINEELAHKPDESPAGRYSQYAFGSISGYKEQVEGSVKACERLAKELGADIITDKFKEQWPGCWEKWEHQFVNHSNPRFARKIRSGSGSKYSYGFELEGIAQGFIVEGGLSDGKRFHKAVLNRFYDKWGLKNIRYYTRQYDHGRTTYLRYVFQSDQYDQESLERNMEMQIDLDLWLGSNEFKKEYPNFFRHSPPVDMFKRPSKDKSTEPPPKKPIGPPPSQVKSRSPYSFGLLRKKIQDIIDPNNIMDPTGKKMEQDMWR